MSADEWDADDFEPVAPKPLTNDKWEGEDEGDDVKDSWDAEDDEGAKKDGGATDDSMKATQRKKKKPLAERIAEKEAARIAKEKEEKEASKVLTKEEKNTEAERLRKIQEQADLKLAKEAFGLDSTSIDSMFPVTEEEFTKFREALMQKITSFTSSNLYASFVEKLTQDLVLELSLDDLKKVSTTSSSLFHEKQRLQKEQTKTKKRKSKKIVMERDTDFGDIAAGQGGDYDDTYYDEDFI